MPRPPDPASTEPAAVPPLPISHVIRLAGRDRNGIVDIALAPDTPVNEALAELLGLDGLTRLRFRGRLAPMGETGWRLTGSLTARLRQTCVVTLEPVVTPVDLPVMRDYLPAREVARLDPIVLDAEDADEPDPFEDEIDVAAALVETLALAIDPYPRAEGAALTGNTVAPPGSEPLDDAAVSPFAALGALRQRLDGDE